MPYRIVLSSTVCQHHTPNLGIFGGISPPPQKTDTPHAATSAEEGVLAMSLTATAVRQAKDKPYKLSGGRGMYLLVNPNGSKYWRFKYRFAGKEKVLAIGVYPDLSLSDANEIRDEARKLLAKKIDPNEEKKALKLARIQEGENHFETVAAEWFKTKMQDRSKSHRDRTWRALEKDLFPQIGRRPINDITPPELLSALRKIEARGRD